MVTAAPEASHLSCWRCSPVACRQLSTWWATKDIQITAIETRMTAMTQTGWWASQPVKWRELMTLPAEST